MAAPKQKPLTLETGPWTGMYYAHPPVSDQRVFMAFNGYVDESGSYRSRPGSYRIASTALGRGQLVYQFTKIDGTQYTVGIAGGKFYTLNWATGVWTEVVTGANFATATITVSSTARCYAVTLNDKMIVSDGVNKPWSWDGQSGAGGLTSLTNAPVFYGQPTVYYAKLFGIKNTERSTVVWSEENDPTTGYEAGGFNNAWTLSQTGSDPLFAIRATNEGLYYWRQRSIGVVRGAVDTDFVNSGVLDAVSNLVGTRSPAGVLYYGGSFYFPDEYGRPTMFESGGGVQSLWSQVALAYTLDTNDAVYLGSGPNLAKTAAEITVMETLPIRAVDRVLFRFAQAVTTPAAVDAAMCFTRGGVAQGFWTLGIGRVGGEVLNSVTNLPEILEIDAVNGVSYAMGKAAQWVDQDDTGANVGISLTVTLPRMAANPVMELHFDRAHAIVGARAAGSITVALAVANSRQQLNNFTQLSQAVTSSITTEEKRIAYGLNKQGRWGQMTFAMTHTSLAAAGFSLSLYSASLTGYPVSLTSGVP